MNLLIVLPLHSKINKALQVIRIPSRFKVIVNTKCRVGGGQGGVGEGVRGCGWGGQGWGWLG